MISFTRFLAVFIKETIQLLRDKPTVGVVLGIPIFQLVIFGFAINGDPKNLPTALNVQDNTVFTRTIVASLKNTGYFSMDRLVSSDEQGAELLQKGIVQFVVTIPQNFTRDLVRGEHPQLLIEADGTDPIAVGNALGGVQQAVSEAIERDLTGPLAHLKPEPNPIEVVVHRNYNPEGITRYNIVPGLMGMIMNMSLVMMTVLAVTREFERGTMENLLATPVRPLEVMLGKITPSIGVGAIQMGVTLLFAKLIFEIPMIGSFLFLNVVLLIFIIINLAVGFTISTLAANQLQATQMSVFWGLPSILLSGFIYPFRGMPDWAQWLGECLPLTHFIRLTRGIMLKGASLGELSYDFWVMILFLILVTILAVSRYRQTLD